MARPLAAAAACAAATPRRASSRNGALLLVVLLIAAHWRGACTAPDAAAFTAEVQVRRRGLCTMGHVCGAHCRMLTGQHDCGPNTGSKRGPPVDTLRITVTRRCPQALFNSHGATGNLECALATCAFLPPSVTTRFENGLWIEKRAEFEASAPSHRPATGMASMTLRT